MMTIYRPCAYLVEKIWGGQFLTDLYDLKGLKGESEPGPIGESWILSTLKEGRKLPSTPGEDLHKHTQLPYLVKWIDTNDHLSIQVHPNDQLAKRFEGTPHGKSECWLITRAEAGAKLYVGLKDHVAKAGPSEFLKALQKGHDVSECLHQFSVRTGDFFKIPAGTIHAIGKGITLLEVQQSSGITYRLWDWNRLDKEGKSRTLHLSKGIQSIDFSPQFNRPENFLIHKNLFNQKGPSSLWSHPQFNTKILGLDKNQTWVFHPHQIFEKNPKRPLGLVNLQGKFEVKMGKFSLQMGPLEALCIPEVSLGQQVQFLGQGSRNHTLIIL